MTENREPLYVSRVTLESSGHLQRRATLPLGGAIEMGVHGPIVQHYRLAPERERVLPVDYVVAAAGG